MAKMKTKRKPAARKAVARLKGIAGITPDALRSRQAKIVEHLKQIDELMSDGVELDDAARERTHRLRGEPEKVALCSVLDYADTRPESFTGLADRDYGMDPATFETGLLRDRLECALVLSEVVDRMDTTRRRFTDSALHVTSLVKPTVLAAYEIAKPLAKHDKTHGQKLNGATNYYGGIARAGVKTRKRKKAAAGNP